MDKKVYEDLLYVELPNLVNRILKEKSKPTSYSTAFDKAVLEISKVVNAEFKAAEVAFKIVSQQQKGEDVWTKKVVETINALCDWIQKELSNIYGNDKESIVPEMIETLTELIKTYRGY